MTFFSSDSEDAKVLGKSSSKVLRQFWNKDSNLTNLILIAITIFFMMVILTSGGFLKVANLQSMAVQVPVLGLLSLAIMASFVAGGIDLSIVAITNLSAILEALVLKSSLVEVSPVFAVVIGILLAMTCGVAAGALNGLLIGKLEFPPILATLGAMQLYGGISIILTGGSAIYEFPSLFVAIGNNNFLGVPIPFIIFILGSWFLAFMFKNTVYGYRLFMLGSNPEASRFSGTNNTSIIVRTHILVGLLAAIAGIILTARVNAARPGYGGSYLLLAILISMMAGVNPEGGEGTVLSIVLVAVILQFLQSGFNLLNLDPFLAKFTWGMLLLAVMIFNYYKNSQSAEKS